MLCVLIFEMTCCGIGTARIALARRCYHLYHLNLGGSSIKRWCHVRVFFFFTLLPKILKLPICIAYTVILLMLQASIWTNSHDYVSVTLLFNWTYNTTFLNSLTRRKIRVPKSMPTLYPTERGDHTYYFEGKNVEKNWIVHTSDFAHIYDCRIERISSRNHVIRYIFRNAFGSSFQVSTSQAHIPQTVATTHDGYVTTCRKRIKSPGRQRFTFTFIIYFIYILGAWRVLV